MAEQDKTSMLETILKMSEEELQALPVDLQEKVIGLRAHYAALEKKNEERKRRLEMMSMRQDAVELRRDLVFRISHETEIPSNDPMFRSYDAMMQSSDPAFHASFANVLQQMNFTSEYVYTLYTFIANTTQYETKITVDDIEGIVADIEEGPKKESMRRLCRAAATITQEEDMARRREDANVGMKDALSIERLRAPLVFLSTTCKYTLYHVNTHSWLTRGSLSRGRDQAKFNFDSITTGFFQLQLSFLWKRGFLELFSIGVAPIQGKIMHTSVDWQIGSILRNSTRLGILTNFQLCALVAFHDVALSVPRCPRHCPHHVYRLMSLLHLWRGVTSCGRNLPSKGSCGSGRPIQGLLSSSRPGSTSLTHSQSLTNSSTWRHARTSMVQMSLIRPSLSASYATSTSKGTKKIKSSKTSTGT